MIWGYSPIRGEGRAAGNGQRTQKEEKMARTQQRNGTGTELVHVGFGNFLAVNKVLAIVTPGSAPIQRMIREGKKKGIIIDITSGRRTKAAVFTETGNIMLVAITPEALAGRVAAARGRKVSQAQAG
jgi:regulator of extracellular matrix RemA (YlzA/DUF370 family)